MIFVDFPVQGAMTARRTLSVTCTANRDQLHITLTYKDTSNYEKMEEPLFEGPQYRILGIFPATLNILSGKFPSPCRNPFQL